MILVWGPSADPPTQRMVAVLRSRGAEFVHVDDQALASLRFDVALGPALAGWIEAGGVKVSLETLAGFYLRPVEVSTNPATLAASTLLAIASAARGPIVNRPWGGRSNWSKPLQSRIIAAAGLAVPDTLVTTDPAAARSFLAKHGRIVYKSISGVRSIVVSLDASNAERLDGVATGPVQFQRHVAGEDVRVHVVGARWFATSVDSAADDYRYGARDGHDIALAPMEIPSGLGERLVALTAEMGLLVSGIDLRLTASGEWYCFEVNPSPGFTFYEDATGQPIAEAIAQLLAQAQLP